MTGCNVHLHPYKDYLDQSVGHATHNALAEKMGAPNNTVDLDGGGDLWTYKYCAVGGGIGPAKGLFHKPLIVKTSSWSLMKLASLFDGMTSI
jgi:hypothetical protein